MSVLFACVYSYIWLVTAEAIRAGIAKEVEEAKNLGIIVEIEDYKYSSFPFAVSVNAQNPKITLNNSAIGKSFIVNVPNIYVSCDIFIKNCTSTINPEEGIEILDKDRNKPLYEIKFLSGITAKTQFEKSLLIASSIEKVFNLDSLISTLGFAAEKIVVLNLETNQEVSVVNNLLLDETYNHDNMSPLVSKIKFSFKIDNSPSTGFYLAQAFSNFSIDTTIENFRHLKDKSNETKEDSW